MITGYATVLPLHGSTPFLFIRSEPDRGLCNPDVSTSGTRSDLSHKLTRVAHMF